MPIILPSPTAVNSLPLPEKQLTVAEVLIEVLQAHPQNRILMALTFHGLLLACRQGLLSGFGP